MEDVSTEKIVSYYDERVAKAGDSGHASLLDDNMRTLEVETVVNWLDAGNRVLEVFCANGVSTLKYAAHCRHITGCDLSEKMIESANRNLARHEPPLSNVVFRQGNVMDVDTLFSPGEFDTVISVRGLSNLPTRDLQKQAILKLHGLLPPQGKFIFLEGDRDGLARINEQRAKFSLPPLAEPWYDNYFVEPELSDFLKGYFRLKDERKLDIYFLVSRVLYPLAAQPAEPSFDSICNTIARLLVPYADTQLGTTLLKCWLLEKI